MESSKAFALQGTSTWCLKVTSPCVRCFMPALKTPFTPRTTASTTSRCPAAGCDARMWVETKQARRDNPPKLRNLESRDPRHALLFCGTLDCNMFFCSVHKNASRYSFDHYDLWYGCLFLLQVQVIPWVISDSNYVRCPAQRLDPSKTVFVGALHGMLNAEALASIMNDLFGGVMYAGIDTDKHKYPIGELRRSSTAVQIYLELLPIGQKV